MSLRNATESAVGALRRGMRRPWSLALRMGLYYGISAFLILLLTTALLYWTLKAQLEWADDLRLLSKLREVRPILEQEPPNMLDLLRDSVKVEYEARSMEPVLIRVKDVSAHVIVETPEMDKALPVGSFQSTWQKMGRPENAYSLKSSLGWPFRAISADVKGKSGTHYIVHIACDHLYEQGLLEHFRNRMRNVLGMAIFICGMLGYLLARRGLRPLSEMGGTLGQIKATTLNVRLDLAGMPSELTTLGVSFNDMLHRLEDAFSRISRYSADIAHELRTPMQNLRNAAEVALARARKPEEYRDALASC